MPARVRTRRWPPGSGQHACWDRARSCNVGPRTPMAVRNRTIFRAVPRSAPWGGQGSRGSRPRFNGATVLDACQVKPMFRMKCPSLRLSTAPPAQFTMNASKMMATTTTTNQKKNTIMPGMPYPATVLALATTVSYPQPLDLFGDETQAIQDQHRVHRSNTNGIDCRSRARNNGLMCASKLTASAGPGRVTAV